MPAFSITDFKLGMDLRKTFVTAPAGSLRLLRNAFITSGAEIEKRTAFVAWGPAPASSFGVLSSAYGQIYVVENGASGITAPPGTGSWGSYSPGIVSLPFPAGVTITHAPAYLDVRGESGY